MGSIEGPVMRLRRLDRWHREWAHLWEDVQAFNALGPFDEPPRPERLQLMRRMMARRHPVELDRLLRALRIDPAALAQRDPARLHEMEVVCTACPSWRRCRKTERAGSLQASYTAFCPNTLMLQALIEGAASAPDCSTHG